jgi:hypothetical protein
MADEDMKNKVLYISDVEEIGAEDPIEHDDIVVAATPQIRVYINGLGHLGICVLQMNEDQYRLDQSFVSIPVEHARTVAEAIIKTIEEFEESQ